jgi:hypothetical protein
MLAESSFSTEAAVHLLPSIDPAVLTLAWQLQYPPGGSTHPCYAYPQMDPRLFFNPTLVPVIDGLPTVFQVPPLTLPMGWRHVSWSGFLPIVFDQFHQAFKLTPIGPLPMTCEEVQQGGLAKYVPGGAAHPEAGLLPDVMALSDGSDEVYNFEDVDWALPWPIGESFDGTPIAAQPPGSMLSPSMQADTTLTIAVTTHSHYLEVRDCPNGIVDIDDAWRWLREKMTTPDTPFVPTPGKTWHGTGIHRTSRKYKQPIASLMGLIFSDTTASPNNFLARFLVNQNGREFCPFRSLATPVHVNMTLLKDIEITLVELLCYFPNHYMWRKGADRLVYAGLTAADITNFINWSRNLFGEAVRQSQSINEQIWWEYEAPGSRKRVKIVREPESESATYTTEGWSYTSCQLIDYPLLGLAHGLKHFPEGPDAGPLTAVMKWCREQGRYDTLLSDVLELLEGAEIQPLIEPGEGGDPDNEILGRYVGMLRRDRKRVLKDASDRRRVAEKEEGKKRKRAKEE